MYVLRLQGQSRILKVILPLTHDTQLSLSRAQHLASENEQTDFVFMESGDENLAPVHSGLFGRKWEICLKLAQE